jgi:mannose-6-phosphate isomerase-like protein (cupin superfamily)
MPHSATALFAIERDVAANDDFRRVVWTGAHAQLVYMSLEPHETIDMEVHPSVDQFFRLEQGDVTLHVTTNAAPLRASSGDAFFVAAGTQHMIRAGPGGAKLYTIYSPPNHPSNRVQRAKPVQSRESADVDEPPLTLMRMLGRIV